MYKQYIVMDVHSSRAISQFLRNVPMDRISELAMNSLILVTQVLSILPVLLMGQHAVMVHVAMSYRPILQTADVSLQCLSSVVKV